MIRVLRSGIAGCLVLLFATAGPAKPVVPPEAPTSLRPLAAYSLQTFTTRDGLPLNYVPEIVQDPRGFLWFGSAEGFSRFDGSHFEWMNRRTLPGLTSDNVGTLAIAADGSLWIGTAGGGVFRLQEGRIVEAIPASALPNPEVVDLAPSADGSLWISLRGGLCRWADSSLTCFGRESGVLDPWTGDLLVSRVPGLGERLWAIVGNRLAVGGPHGFETLSLGLEPTELPETLALAPDGVVWLGTSSSRVGRLVDGTFVAEVELDAAGRIMALAFDDQGALWIGTGGAGLFRWHAETIEQLSVANGLSNDRVLSLLFDREGFLWAGTFAGLVRIDDSLFSVYDRRHGMTPDTVVGVTAGPDELFVATDGGGLFRFDGFGLERLSDPTEADQQVRSLLVRSDGSLWGGSRTGVQRWDRDRWRPVPTPADQARVTALFEDSEGCLWIGMTQSGVHRSCGEGWQTWGEGHGPRLSGVYTFVNRSAGGVWIGGRDGLVQIDAEGEATLYGLDSGLPDLLVTALHEDPEGALWLGTVNAGLVRFLHDRFVAIDETSGLPSNTVWAILPDTNGHLWLSSNYGVSRVATEELTAVAEGRSSRLNAARYGPSEGLIDPECVGGSINAGTLTPSGGLAFATSRGVAIVEEPEAAAFDPAPPEVFVTKVTVDGRRLPLGPQLELPPQGRRVVVTAGAPTAVSAQRVQLRYRLIGFEEAWQIVGTERQITFTNLPPGGYELELAATRDGRSWGKPSILAVSVPARWYQRLEAKTLAILLLVTAFTLFYRLRLRELRRREAELAVMVAERTEALRLANDELERRNQQLAHLSTRDPLTGLANRRRLESALATEWRRATRHRHPLSLLMVDVDEFKAYNDSQGHPAGDSCLRDLAEVLRAVSQRSADVVARYGGEEFAVLLPETAREDARHLAERIRVEVQARAIPHPESPVGSVVTVSVGLASIVPDGGAHEGQATLVEAADQALYRAKRQGRNRVVG